MPLELDLRVAAPLHIGTGETLGREGLVFEGGVAFVPDLDAYFRDNPNDVQPFVAAMERGEPVGDFITDPDRYAEYTLDPWVDTDEVDEVAVAIKDIDGRPYIPGSSIKGFVRTALAHRALTTGGRSLSAPDDGAVDELFRLGEDDPKHDIMRCLTVRDTTPAAPDDLVLVGTETQSFQKSGSMQPKFWTNHSECLAPGTGLRTEVAIDTATLDGMVTKFGESRKVDAVFGADRSEDAILETVTDALGAFATDIAREDRTLTGEFDRLESFYDELETGRCIRVGTGTGYHSNTVATALPRTDRVGVRVDHRLGKKLTHDGCGGTVTPDKHQAGALFCHECYSSMPIGEADVSPPFPKTRRIVRKDGAPAYPLGWVEFRSEHTAG